MADIITKIANTIEMSFDVPDSEQQQAQDTVDAFKKVLSTIDAAKKHLDLMYEPFKEAQDVPEEALLEYRGAIYRYKEQIKKNFNDVKGCAFLAMSKLKMFATDTHVTELLNTFKNTISDLEENVSALLDTLTDLKNQEFKDKLVKAIDSIDSASIEIEKLINDRIFDYIDTNILAKDWVSSARKQLKQEVEEHIPYITQLFEERQRALGN